MISREHDAKNGRFLPAHGSTGTKTFRSWSKMHRRCTNPNAHNWPRYGGRGIEICQRWQHFENFMEDLGECPPGMTLDRINPNGNYEPSNCRWATMRTQSRNRTNNVVIEHDGRKQCLSAWAEETGIKIGTLWWRYRAGWTASRILTQPVAQ